jgi:hypothetical protein
VFPPKKYETNKKQVFPEKIDKVEKIELSAKVTKIVEQICRER